MRFRLMLSSMSVAASAVRKWFLIGLEAYPNRAKRGRVSLYWDRLPMFVRSTRISSSNISKTLWARITKFHRDIHTGIFYSPAGYYVIIYFRSEVIGESSRFYRLRQLLGEFLENGSSQDHEIYTLIEDKRPHKPARNGDTSSFRSAAKCY